MYILYVSISALKKIKEDPNFTEDDWCDIKDPSCGAYEESKTVEEQRSYEFVKENNGLLNKILIKGIMQTKY